MSKTTISKVKTYYDLTSIDDIVALLDQIDTSQVVPVHCTGAVMTALISDNVQTQGTACNINGSYIDLFLQGVSLGYVYIFRVNSSGQVTVKRRGSMNPF